MDANIRKIVFKEIMKSFSKSQAIICDTSSSESSSSDEEMIIKEKRKRHVRVKNYTTEIVPKYSKSDFKSHFRMERNTTVQTLIELYGTEKITSGKGGWPRISVEKSVLMTIWYLSNTETFRQVSDRFDVTISCAYNTVSEFIKFLVCNAHNYIKWPDRNKAHLESVQFHKKKNIKSVLGAIDGSHIQINRPRIHQEDYYNRKCYHSIILQGVVNSKMELLDVYVGEPGSMHDARVLRRSPLYKRAVENAEELFYGNYYLLGDSAYPSLNWLVPPFKDNGHLTNDQKDFNYRHSATRIVIENTFGHLKGRFRRLQKFDNYKPSFIVNAVLACCVLHNMCISAKDICDAYYDDTFEQDALEAINIDNDVAARDVVFNNMYVT